MGKGSFPGVKYGRDVLLTSHHILVPFSWKIGAIPLAKFWDKTGPVTGTGYLYFLLIKQAKTMNLSYAIPATLITYLFLNKQ
jgi:hypothetical protein